MLFLNCYFVIFSIFYYIIVPVIILILNINYIQNLNMFVFNYEYVKFDILFQRTRTIKLLGAKHNFINLLVCGYPISKEI